MSTPETLVQAALNRLAARLGSSVMDAAAQFSVMAQDAPQKLQQELELFWQEVQQEAERIEQPQAASTCLLYTSPSPRDYAASRMPSSA